MLVIASPLLRASNGDFVLYAGHEALQRRDEDFVDALVSGVEQKAHAPRNAEHELERGPFGLLLGQAIFGRPPRQSTVGVAGRTGTPRVPMALPPNPVPGRTSGGRWCPVPVGHRRRPGRKLRVASVGRTKPSANWSASSGAAKKLPPDTGSSSMPSSSRHFTGHIAGSGSARSGATRRTASSLQVGDRRR